MVTSGKCHRDPSSMKVIFCLDFSSGHQRLELLQAFHLKSPRKDPGLNLTAFHCLWTGHRPCLEPVDKSSPVSREGMWCVDWGHPCSQRGSQLSNQESGWRKVKDSMLKGELQPVNSTPVHFLFPSFFLFSPLPSPSLPSPVCITGDWPRGVLYARQMLRSWARSPGSFLLLRNFESRPHSAARASLQHVILLSQLHPRAGFWVTGSPHRCAPPGPPVFNDAGFSLCLNQLDSDSVVSCFNRSSDGKKKERDSYTEESIL